MEITDVVILAGGKAEKLDPSSPFKGLVEAGGRTLIEHTVEKLMAMPRFKKIVVTVPADVLSESALPRLRSAPQYLTDPRIKQVVTDGGVIENLTAGVRETEGNYVLVTTVDVPFLTGSSIEKMITDCSAQPADFYYPIITESSVRSKFPDFSKTFARIKEGRFAGGNVFITKRSVPIESGDVINALFELRKSPVKLVKRLGAVFLFKFALKILTVKDLETKVSELMHNRGRAVIVEPDIGIDIDDQEELKKYNETLEKEMFDPA